MHDDGFRAPDDDFEAQYVVWEAEGGANRQNIHFLHGGLLLPHVTGPIVGTEFREVLAAIWGRDMKIDGMPLFPPGYDQ